MNDGDDVKGEREDKRNKNLKISGTDTGADVMELDGQDEEHGEEQHGEEQHGVPMELEEGDENAVAATTDEEDIAAITTTLRALHPFTSTGSFDTPERLRRYQVTSTTSSMQRSRSCMGALTGVLAHNVKNGDAYWRMIGTCEIMLQQKSSHGPRLFCWGSSGEASAEWNWIKDGDWYLCVMSPCFLPRESHPLTLRYDFSLTSGLFTKSTPSRAFFDAVLKVQGGEVWGVSTCTTDVQNMFRIATTLV